MKFRQAGFRNTAFEDESFDAIWGLESTVHDPNKIPFLNEANRILKKDGRIILGEYLRPQRELKSKEIRLLRKWLNPQAMADIADRIHFEQVALEQGFSKIDFDDITPFIRKSSWRMFYGSFFLAVLSSLYRLYNPKVTSIAHNHYKGIFYQYLALRQKLWENYFIRISK